MNVINKDMRKLLWTNDCFHVYQRVPSPFYSVSFVLIVLRWYIWFLLGTFNPWQPVWWTLECIHPSQAIRHVQLIIFRGVLGWIYFVALDLSLWYNTDTGYLVVTLVHMRVPASCPLVTDSVTQPQPTILMSSK